MMPKVSKWGMVNGKIAGRGVLRLTTNSLGKWRRQTEGNITILVVGAGARQLGCNPHTWFFLVDGRPYKRIVGNGDRGQCWVKDNRWHTRVQPVLGKARQMLLDAIA